MGFDEYFRYHHGAGLESCNYARWMDILTVSNVRKADAGDRGKYETHSYDRSTHSSR